MVLLGCLAAADSSIRKALENHGIEQQKAFSKHSSRQAVGHSWSEAGLGGKDDRIGDESEVGAQEDLGEAVGRDERDGVRDGERAAGNRKEKDEEVMRKARKKVKRGGKGKVKDSKKGTEIDDIFQGL